MSMHGSRIRLQRTIFEFHQCIVYHFSETQRGTSQQDTYVASISQYDTHERHGSPKSQLWKLTVTQSSRSYSEVSTVLLIIPFIGSSFFVCTKCFLNKIQKQFYQSIYLGKKEGKKEENMN